MSLNIDEVETLKQRWIALFAPVYAHQAQQVFGNILQQYGQKHRHYHTISHIQACLKWLDAIKQNLKHAHNIELAIWLHDVIYEPLKANNEEKSAQYAQQILPQLGLTQLQIKEISDLILLTKHPAMPKNSDEQYLLDIDLSVLGAHSTVYAQYEQNIRQEYKYVPMLMYKKGRSKLLQSFLAMPQIYHTTYFSNLLEAQALLNLNWAINNLK